MSYTFSPFLNLRIIANLQVTKLANDIKDSLRSHAFTDNMC